MQANNYPMPTTREELTEYDPTRWDQSAFQQIIRERAECRRLQMLAASGVDHPSSSVAACGNPSYLAQQNLCVRNNQPAYLVQSTVDPPPPVPSADDDRIGVSEVPTLLSSSCNSKSTQQQQEAAAGETAPSAGSKMNPILGDIREFVLSSVNTPNAELEIHIGRIKQPDKVGGGTSSFDSQVSEVWFQTVYQQLRSLTIWDHQSSDWERREEFLYANQVRLRRAPDGVSHFIQKCLISKMQVAMKDGKYDFSLVLKTETPAHLNYADPIRFRFGERWLFQCQCFEYALTKVWELEAPLSRYALPGATSSSDGHAAVSTSPEVLVDVRDTKSLLIPRPKFEIELELKPDWLCSDQASVDLDRAATNVAMSILKRCVTDLVGKHVPSLGPKWTSPASGGSSGNYSFDRGTTVPEHGGGGALRHRNGGGFRGNSNGYDGYGRGRYSDADNNGDRLRFRNDRPPREEHGGGRGRGGGNGRGGGHRWGNNHQQNRGRYHSSSVDDALTIGGDGRSSRSTTSNDPYPPRHSSTTMRQRMMDAALDYTHSSSPSPQSGMYQPASNQQHHSDYDNRDRMPGRDQLNQQSGPPVHFHDDAYSSSAAVLPHPPPPPYPSLAPPAGTTQTFDPSFLAGVNQLYHQLFAAPTMSPYCGWNQAAQPVASVPAAPQLQQPSSMDSPLHNNPCNNTNNNSTSTPSNALSYNAVQYAYTCQQPSSMDSPLHNNPCNNTRVSNNTTRTAVVGQQHTSDVGNSLGRSNTNRLARLASFQ